MSYRFDHRTKEQFTKDIKNYHKTEIEIVIRICEFFRNKNTWPKLTSSGCDYTGQYLSDDKVDHEADFKINNEYFEITHSNYPCKKNFFRQKVNKVHRCIDDQANLVFVNGVKNKEPEFIIIKPQSLKTLTQQSKEEYGNIDLIDHTGKPINKPCYRYNFKWFDGQWEKLPPITDAAKTYYKDILKNV